MWVQLGSGASRPIKRRCAPMLGLKTLRTAEVTLAGVELAHRIRKGQFLLRDQHLGQRSLKQMWDIALHLSDHTRSTCSLTRGQPCLHQNSILVVHSNRRAKRSEQSPKQAKALCQKSIRRPRFVPACTSKRRSILALQLSIRRQSQNTGLWRVSGCLASEGQSPSLGSQTPSGGRHRSFNEETRHYECVTDCKTLDPTATHKWGDVVPGNKVCVATKARFSRRARCGRYSAQSNTGSRFTKCNFRRATRHQTDRRAWPKGALYARDTPAIVGRSRAASFSTKVGCV